MEYSLKRNKCIKMTKLIFKNLPYELEEFIHDYSLRTRIYWKETMKRY